MEKWCFLQNSAETSLDDDKSLCLARYYRRLQLMLRALLAVIGESLRNSFLTQQCLVKVSNRTNLLTNKNYIF